MPRNVRLILRSGTTTPSAADFDVGEPAWDKAGGKLYIKNQAGSMVQVGGGGGGAALAATTLDYTTASLAVGAAENFTLATGSVYVLLAVTCSHPAWIRVYGSSAARDSDTRQSPGYPYPASGSGFYAEVLTSSLAQTITLSPSPNCQASSGTAYLRILNRHSGTTALTTSFSVLTITA